MKQEVRDERQMIGSQKRFTAAMQRHVPECQKGVEIDVVQMQEGQDAWIRARPRCSRIFGLLNRELSRRDTKPHSLKFVKSL